MGPLRVEDARTLEQLELLHPAWDQLAWQREEAAYPYYVTRLRTRPGVIGPFAVVVLDEDIPVAGLAGRIELRRLQTTVGHRDLYAPTVRVLQIVDGGIATTRGDGTAKLVRAVEQALAAGDADVAALPPLEVGSELSSAFGSLGGPLTRQPLIAPWRRRLLRLPPSFEEFLASRSHKTRKGIRRDGRQLEAAFGDRLELEIVTEPRDADRLVREADRVSQATYQRSLGAGFTDTPEQRELARVGLEHRWLRGYLLKLDGSPIAFWLCTRYGTTMLLRTGGFDAAHAEHRVGIHLLMGVIADACDDPTIELLDFGPGDAAYKQQFSNESHEERNAVIFAPTFRGRRINAARTAILAPARLARAGLDATDLTARTRASLRARGRRA